jgi:hypothetical protein
MMNLPRSLYGNRGGRPGMPPPRRAPAPPGGGMGRLAQINPSMMARLSRRGSPAPQAAPQAYGGPPTPQVPFQGGQPGGQSPAGPGGGQPGGMPDMKVMGEAIGKIFGGGDPAQSYGEQTDSMVQSGMVPPDGMPAGALPGVGGGAEAGGIDPKMMMGLMKFLPMLAGAPPVP